MTTKISVENLVNYANAEYKAHGKSELFEKIEEQVLALNHAKLSYEFLSNCEGADKEKHIRVMFNSKNRVDYLNEIVSLTKDEKMLEDVYNFYMSERKKLVLPLNKINYKFSSNAYNLAVKYPKADANKLFDFVLADGSYYNMHNFMKLENVDARKILKGFFKHIDNAEKIKGDYYAYLYKNYMSRKNKVEGLDLQKTMIDKLMSYGPTAFCPYESFFHEISYQKLPFEQIDLDYMIESAIKTNDERWAYLVITTIISLAQRAKKEEKLKNVDFQPLLNIALEKSSMDTLTNLASWLNPYLDITQIEDHVRKNGTFQDAFDYIFYMAKRMKNYPAMEQKIINEISNQDIYLLKELFTIKDITRNNTLNASAISQRILSANNADISRYFANYCDVDFDKHLQIVEKSGNEYAYEKLKEINNYRQKEKERKIKFESDKFLNNKEDIELLF